MYTKKKKPLCSLLGVADTKIGRQLLNRLDARARKKVDFVLNIELSDALYSVDELLYDQLYTDIDTLVYDKIMVEITLFEPYPDAQT